MNKDQLKLVVVDEDGTFLDQGDEGFSRERFRAVFSRMREAGCRFAVATSNQSFQVKEIFGDLAPYVSVIASNGAYVEPEGMAPAVSTASSEAVARVLAAHEAHPAIPLCTVCADGAYVERDAEKSFVEEMTMYSHNMRLVDSLAEPRACKDVLMYWSRVGEDELDRAAGTFRAALAPAGESPLMDVVDSGVEGGYGYFDVVQRGVSKATGAAAVARALGIDPSCAMAFGDAGNDVEMLRWAGCGVAMGNASDEVKACADRVCDPCREQGVLKVLEEVFGR